MKYEKNERAYEFDSAAGIESMLGEGERILWQGKPKKSAFIANKVLAMLPFALLWAAVDVAFVVLVFVLDAPTVMQWIVVAFVCLHLLPFWIWLSNVLTANRRYKNMHYALTDRRIMIRSGLVGIDYQSVSYKDIQNVDLRVGVADKLLKVGDVYFVTAAGNRKTVFFDIEQPYEVYKTAQKIVTDIQADIAYPNAYRPEENPGYGTKYGGGKGNGSG